MKHFFKKTFVLVLMFCVSGCSVLMPYKDEFRCNKGVGEGYCASMSENYREMQTSTSTKTMMVTTNKTAPKETEAHTKSDLPDCQKCQDVSEAVWLKQRDFEKKYGITQ